MPNSTLTLTRTTEPLQKLRSEWTALRSWIAITLSAAAIGVLSIAGEPETGPVLMLIAWSAVTTSSLLTALVLHKRRRERWGGGSDTSLFVRLGLVDAVFLAGTLRIAPIDSAALLTAIQLGMGIVVLWPCRRRMTTTETLPLALVALSLPAVAIAWSWGATSAAGAFGVTGVSAWILYQIRLSWRVL